MLHTAGECADRAARAGGAPLLPQLGIQLAHPIDDTRLLVQAALAGLDPIYREGYAYSKCAVVLGSIVQTDEFTPDPFAPVGQGARAS